MNSIVTMEPFVCAYILLTLHLITESWSGKTHTKIHAFSQCALLCIGESLVHSGDKKYVDKFNQVILSPVARVSPRASPRHGAC